MDKVEIKKTSSIDDIKYHIGQIEMILGNKDKFKY